MYTRIDSNQVLEFHTDLNPILRAIEKYVENFFWVISDHDFQYLNPEKYDNRLNANVDPIIISGRELLEITNSTKIQFIWGVISGFDKEPIIDLTLKNKFSSNDYTPESYLYSSAILEIDCFDSSFTIIRSENKRIIESMIEVFGHK